MAVLAPFELIKYRHARVVDGALSVDVVDLRKRLLVLRQPRVHLFVARLECGFSVVDDGIEVVLPAPVVKGEVLGPGRLLIAVSLLELRSGRLAVVNIRAVEVRLVQDLHADQAREVAGRRHAITDEGACLSTVFRRVGARLGRLRPLPVFPAVRSQEHGPRVLCP